MPFLPFEKLNHAIKATNGYVYAALKGLEDDLKKLLLPTVEEVQLKSIVKNENVFHDNLGNILIQVTLLESPVQIGEMFLRADSGVWEQSTDGSTWVPLVTESIPEEIQNPVTIGTQQLRDNAGVLERSTDGGVTWLPVKRPTVNGAELMTLSPVNLFDMGDGDFQVLPSVFPTQVRIGNLHLKDLGDGKLYLSTDGVSWSYAFDQNNPDVMMGYTYDTDDDGIVDKAEQLYDGSTAIDVAYIQGLEARIAALEGA